MHYYNILYTVQILKIHGATGQFLKWNVKHLKEFENDDHLHFGKCSQTSSLLNMMPQIL